METKNGWGLLITAVLTVVVLWLLNWVFVWNFLEKSDERGNFGDMFGAINALFSGLAFAFLIYTIWIQREELKLQREELKLQRQALELQATELKRQADELEKNGILQVESLEIQRLQMKMAEEQSEEARNRLELENKPIFKSNGRLGGSYNAETARLDLKLINVGGNASNLKIRESPSLEQSGKEYGFIGNNEEIILNWDIKDVPSFPEEVEIQLTFSDLFGKQHTQSIKFINDKTKINEADKFKIVQH